MTIKDVEQQLGVPRATIRFYERERLISPVRGSNGYRDYSADDVSRLKEIILLRKIGLSVNDVEDILDGARILPEVLEENIKKLQTQMEELNGAITLTKKIQNDSLDTNRLDIDKYWDILEDEERKGGKFMDIAKDIARSEKRVIFSFKGWTDRDCNLYNSASDIVKFCGLVILIACIYCLVRNEWSVKNFVFGMSGILALAAVEGILSIPLYFLSKKYKWVKENRIKALIISMVIIAAVFFVVAMILN
ncbi:MAG: MerR family transcriptional regulator [Pseudobutyrivibrio sp.]|nr:MerR family transcriptional regulator [Pseudobutyrivibrio sp.]